jgi:hypothetical protein
VTVAIHPRRTRHLLTPGMSLPVAADDQYAIANEPGATARLLKLSLALPNKEDVEISDFLTPTPILRSPPAGPPMQTQLFSAGPVTLSGESWLLFLSCLIWHDPNAATDVHQHPGPFGMRLVQGRLEVDLPDGRRSLDE